MPQKLTSRALVAKRKRDLAAANTRRREKMRAENQRKRRKAIKAGKPQKEIDGLRARLKNLKDMLEDNPEDLVDDLSRGFKRGGLAKTGSMDYRKKGLFY